MCLEVLHGPAAVGKHSGFEIRSPGLGLVQTLVISVFLGELLKAVFSYTQIKEILLNALQCERIPPSNE